MRTLLATLVLAIALPASALGRSPQATDASEGHLSEAFWFLPPGGTNVAFTDWGRIRASQGAADLTGDSPLEAKVDVLMSTNEDEAAASAYALRFLRDHRALWGFDSFDLDWEATLSVDGPPVFVLRFRDGFDVASLMSLFDERGFSTTQADGAVIRSHDMDVTADWLHGSEFAILNTAFLDDGRTLVLSSGLKGVTDVLATRGMPRPLMRGLTPVLDALAGASAAWLAVGPGTCLGFAPLPLVLGVSTSSMPPPPSGEPLHPYVALGVGYARPDWDPMGRIAMGFPHEAWAQADAGPRTEEARSGVGLRLGEPYADSLFTLERSAVRDGALVLEVEPLDDHPQRLFQMVGGRDMTFARC